MTRQRSLFWLLVVVVFFGAVLLGRCWPYVVPDEPGLSIQR